MNALRLLGAGALAILVALAACGGGSDGGSAAPAATSGSGVIGTGGGTVATTNGNASVVFPANALAANTTVTVDASASPPASTRLVTGTAFDFGPSGAFAQPARLSLKYVPANLPAGALESRLALYTAVGGAWQPVAGSTVDSAAHTVSADVTHFSTFAILANNQFAGTYAGTYVGTSSGTWNATVDTAGVMLATASGGFVGTGSVNFTGGSTVPLGGSGASNGTSVTFAGTFALQSDGLHVLANGNWNGSDGGSGTWTGNKQ